MLITIKDLKIGDEIIIPSNSKLKYLKVLKLPRLHKNLNWNNQPYYSSVRCSVGGVIETKQYKNWRGDMKDYTRSEFEFETDCTKHTIKRNFNLNYHMIWLVKREINLEQEQKSTIFA